MCRLGANYLTLPINRPHNKLHQNHYDGFMNSVFRDEEVISDHIPLRPHCQTTLSDHILVRPHCVPMLFAFGTVDTVLNWCRNFLTLDTCRISLGMNPFGMNLSCGLNLDLFLFLMASRSTTFPPRATTPRTGSFLLSTLVESVLF